MDHCKNCNQPLNGKYCSNCGEPAVLKRIDSHYITHEIEHVLHFERGILYTVKGLLTHPGERVKHFIDGSRSRLVKPVIYIIVTSLIYTLVNHFFHIEEGYIAMQQGKEATTGPVFHWIQGNYGYANIMIGVFIAFWTRLFFRKYGYNFFEILILLCFAMGTAMLLFAVFAIVQGLMHIEMMQVAGAVGIGYCCWAIGQFFDKRKWSVYLKAFAAYMLGMISFLILAVALELLLGAIIKQ